MAFAGGALQQAPGGAIAQQPHEVKAGDSLQAIAARAYGTEAAWTIIAQANALSPPYVSLSGLPGTVKPGDVLVLPGAAGAGSGSVFPRADASPEERLFGRDIYRNEETREWEVGPSGADIRRTRGDESVIQCINARLQTDRGSNPVFPTLGVRSLVGQPNHATTAALLLTDVREQLVGDDRVQAVEEPSGEDRGASVAVQFTVALTGGRRLSGVEAAGVLSVQVAQQ
jgi:LysM repeat protein